MSRGHAGLGIASFAALGALLALPCFSAPLFDDAYIHARIARQLLETGAPQFNAGVALKTDSATGYLLLLAAATWCTGDALSALRAIQGTCVALYVTALGVYGVLLQGRVTLAHGLLSLLALPPLLWAAYGGMETSLAALCLLLCAIDAARARQERALAWACLAACVRIELAAFALFYAVRSRGAEVQPARVLAACSPLAVCIAFDLVFYGSVIPQAAFAKSIAYHLPWIDSLRLATGVSFEHYALPLGALHALALGSWLLARWRGARGEPLEDGLLLESALLLAAWALGRSILFPWYVATFTGCVALVALRGASRSASGVARVQSLAASLQLALLAALSLVTLRVDLDWARPELASGVRAQRYLEIGRELYAYCPRCALLSSEIGGLGYAFRGQVQDALGLADREASRFHPLAVPAQRSSHRVGAIPPAYVALRKPELIVSMPVFSEAFRRSPLPRAYQAYDCPLVPAQPSLKLWGDATIEIFSSAALPDGVLARMRCAGHR